MGRVRVRDQPDLREAGLISQLAGGGEVPDMHRVVGPTQNADGGGFGISLAP